MDYDKLKNADAKLKVLLLDSDKRKGFVEKLKKVTDVHDAYKAVLSILRDVAEARHNKNMKKAESLLKVVYIRIANTTSIKRALNVSEIQKVLEKKDYLGDFYKKMLVAENVLDKARKYIEKGTSLCNTASGFYALYVGHTYRQVYKSKLSKAAQLREEMRYGQEQMMHVMSITSELASFAPPGIKEYLEYNFKAFQACGKTFDRVNKYAKKIENLSSEVFPELREVIGSNKISSKSGRETEKMKGTVNQQLDVLFKMAN